MCNSSLALASKLSLLNLGGIAFDEVLVEFVRQEFKKKYKADVSENRRSMQKLRVACERTKRALSRQDTAPCAVESLYDGLDYNGTILRGRFDMMAEPLYVKCKEAVLSTLKACQLTPDQVDEVILIGGSSRMPRFQSSMKSLFSSEKTEFRSDVEPDEAISIGCALQAKIFLENKIDFTTIDDKIAHADHLTKSVGLAAQDGTFVPFIPKGTPLPVRRELSFNLPDGQTEVYLTVFEGENTVAKDNVLLAEAVLSDLVQENKEKRVVNVVFTIELDKTFSVTLSEKSSGQKLKFKI